MNTSDLHSKIQNPSLVSAEDSPLLEEVLQEFPYFQSARALYLKSLHNQKSFKYNSELKKAAAHTTDRDILFDFITSNDFVLYKPFTLASKSDIQEPKAATNKPSTLIDSIISSIASVKQNELNTAPVQVEKSEKQVNVAGNDSTDPTTSTNQEIDIIEKRLHLGEPLEFDKKEKHSFQEWLQLYKTGPINRTVDQEKEEKEENIDPKRQKKLDLIDKFIESNPKIITTKNMPLTPINIEVSNHDNSSLMTETLAKIYLEQKKYQKAIQAYEILILKYPEKSSFFADQIIDIKALQQHNS